MNNAIKERIKRELFTETNSNFRGLIHQQPPPRLLDENSSLLFKIQKKIIQERSLSLSLFLSFDPKRTNRGR